MGLYHVGRANMDQGAYDWGGSPDEAANTANYYANTANQGELRQGPQIDQGGAYGQDRTSQQQGLTNLYNASMGVGVSPAQQQLQAGMHQAQQAQMSGAASAHGGGSSLAAAQRLGNEQSANIAGQAGQQVDQLRAQEMATARGQYQTAANAAAGQSGQMAMTQAQLEEQQRKLNDQHAQALNTLSYGALNAGTLSRMARDQQNANNFNMQNTTNSNSWNGKATNDAATQNSAVSGIAQLGAGLLTAAAVA